VIVGQDREKLHSELSKVISGNAKKGSIPPLWDGHASERIAASLGR
jgi:UDP-N-acetylglucosamine 2-epimerase (non-hydrolysing)